MISGLVQTKLVAPSTKEFQTVHDDAMKIKNWKKNRLTRLLLVFILSTLGSAIGTFIALIALLFLSFA